MPRKVTYEQALVSHCWVALDPADTGVIEKLFKKDIREGEERLMLAVLENAVEDFQKYVLARNPRGKQLFQEAEEWFLDKDGEALYSFESICETLGLHPDHIRKGLMVWKEAKLSLSIVDAQCAARPKLTRATVKRPSFCALVNFPCPSLTVGSPEAPVSRGSCHGMFAAPFIAPS